MILIMLLLSACHGNEKYIQKEVYEELNIRTLRILAPSIYYSVLRKTEIQMDNFQIHATFYSLEERQNQFLRLQLMLMSGITGYDIFFEDGHPIWLYSSTGFLTNIYELIDQCSSYDREDFYTNVLEAFEFNEGLYSFPLSFGFIYVGINYSLPPVILTQFAKRETVTIHELFHIYNNLRQTYNSRWDHFYVGNTLELRNAANAINSVILDFVNFNDRISSLTNDRFVTEINEIQNSFGNNGVINTPIYASFPINLPEFLYKKSNRNVFFNESLALSPLNAFLNMSDSNFIHFIPLSSGDGGLLLEQGVWQPNSFWGSVCIVSSGDTYLAWEFTTYLITAMTNYNSIYPPNIGNFGNTSFSTPIKRAYFHNHINAVINTAFRWRDFGVTIEERNNVIYQLEIYNNMSISNRPYLSQEMFEEPLLSFLLGSTTVHEMAGAIHNRLSLWFMEIE